MSSKTLNPTKRIRSAGEAGPDAVRVRGYSYSTRIGSPMADRFWVSSQTKSGSEPLYEKKKQILCSIIWIGVTGATLCRQAMGFGLAGERMVTRASPIGFIPKE